MIINPLIESEVGRLQQVLIHQPGPEVESVTPATAERALYSDILNLSVASEEYRQFANVLRSTCEVIELRELLAEALNVDEHRSDIIDELVQYSGISGLKETLIAYPNDLLARLIIEGIPMPKASLSSFLSEEQFAIYPMHNIFFTRDASFTLGSSIVVGCMAKPIRRAEARLMGMLFKLFCNSPKQLIQLDEPADKRNALYIEGGDVLVVGADTLLIGLGVRTNADGIDQLVQKLHVGHSIRNIVVQELPSTAESFIHLDMVFTLVDSNACIVYKPLLHPFSGLKTVHMKIDGNQTTSINYEENILVALRKCQYDLEPIYCGNGDDLWEKREQWHSGANFFALAPGKIIGYARNEHTTEALQKKGFDVIHAKDYMAQKKSIDDYNRCLITIDGGELSRGGGGPRCMTMPLRRAKI